MQTTTIELTPQEAQVLINLINIAVQARGLEAAEAGVHFSKKLQAAMPQPAPPAEPMPDEAVAAVGDEAEEGTE